MWKELLFTVRRRSSGLGNYVTSGFLLSLIILFSTLSYVHIGGLYAQNLKNPNAVTHVSNQVLVQSMSNTVYATMIAEDDIESSQLIRDTSISQYY